MAADPEQGQLTGDAELITRVRNGDRGAFGELYRRHHSAAVTLARQFGRSRAEADDLVAESFARVLDGLLAGKGPDTAFRAYLFTTLRHTAYDRTRKDRKLEFTDNLATLESATDDPDPVVVNAERGFVGRAFASLPERWQTVLWHTQVEGQTPAQVGELLGMAPNAVTSLAFRAREGLREAYLQAHLAETAAERCRSTVDRLGAWARGGLSKREQAQVDAHLDECERCKALALELTEINSGLRALLAPLLLGGAAAGYVATLGPVAALTKVGVFSGAPGGAPAGASGGGAAGGPKGLSSSSRGWAISGSIAAAAAAVVAAVVIANTGTTSNLADPPSGAPSISAANPGANAGGDSGANTAPAENGPNTPTMPNPDQPAGNPPVNVVPIGNTRTPSTSAANTSAANTGALGTGAANQGGFFTGNTPRTTPAGTTPAGTTQNPGTTSSNPGANNPGGNLPGGNNPGGNNPGGNIPGGNNPGTTSGSAPTNGTTTPPPSSTAPTTPPTRTSPSPTRPSPTPTTPPPTTTPQPPKPAAVEVSASEVTQGLVAGGTGTVRMTLTNNGGTASTPQTVAVDGVAGVTVQSVSVVPAASGLRRANTFAAVAACEACTAPAIEPGKSVTVDVTLLVPPTALEGTLTIAIGDLTKTVPTGTVQPGLTKVLLDHTGQVDAGSTFDAALIGELNQTVTDAGSVTIPLQAGDLRIVGYPAECTVAGGNLTCPGTVADGSANFGTLTIVVLPRANGPQPIPVTLPGGQTVNLETAGGAITVEPIDLSSGIANLTGPYEAKMVGATTMRCDAEGVRREDCSESQFNASLGRTKTLEIRNDAQILWAELVWVAGNEDASSAVLTTNDDSHEVNATLAQTQQKQSATAYRYDVTDFITAGTTSVGVTINGASTATKNNVTPMAGWTLSVIWTAPGLEPRAITYSNSFGHGDSKADSVIPLIQDGTAFTKASAAVWGADDWFDRCYAVDGPINATSCAAHPELAVDGVEGATDTGFHSGFDLLEVGEGSSLKLYAFEKLPKHNPAIDWIWFGPTLVTRLAPQ